MKRPVVAGAPDATTVSHAADRLARALVVATNSPIDLRTITAWGESAGVSRGALRVWCRAAGVQAKAALDFLRVLRAVIQSRDTSWDLFSTLDVVDERSLGRLLTRGGIVQFRRSARPPTLEDFLTHQRFFDNPPLVAAVSRRLRRSDN